MRRPLLAVTGLLFVAAWDARASDYSAIDFSLRFPAAMARFSPYSDVAGFGGASAAGKYASSLNPAATDWENTLERPVALSGQYNAIAFQNAPTLHVFSESGALKTRQAGSFQLAAAQIRNDGSPTGDFQLVDGDYASGQWGYKVSPAFAVGANFNYTSVHLRDGFGGTLAVVSHSDTYDARVGALFAPLPRLMAGFVIDYSRTPSKTDFLDPSCSCFVQVEDTTTEVLIRPGVSYQYGEQSSINVDFQHGEFKNSMGTFTTDRVFAGVEQRLVSWLFGRAGLVYDFRGTASPTLGIGIYPSEGMAIDIAYQHDMFPELRPEFGRSDLYSISACFMF